MTAFNLWALTKMKLMLSSIELIDFEVNQSINRPLQAVAQSPLTANAMQLE
jgi:hypothetical protein